MARVSLPQTCHPIYVIGVAKLSEHHGEVGFSIEHFQIRRLCNFAHKPSHSLKIHTLLCISKGGHDIYVLGHKMSKELNGEIHNCVLCNTKMVVVHKHLYPIQIPLLFYFSFSNFNACLSFASLIFLDHAPCHL